MSNNQIIEAMTEEMAKIVGEIHAAATAPDTSDAPTILASVTAIVPSANHVTTARRMGIEPAAHLQVIRHHVAELVEALKQFATHVPPDDPNGANVSALIERLI